MTPRVLPVLNAIGCLLLTGLVVAQWRKERMLDGTLTELRGEVFTARQQAADEAERRAALQRDIAVLKESIEATQQAAEASARSLAEKDRMATQLQRDLTAARAQVTTWETSLKARDERIRSLDADLAATRKRLAEAIARLKDAAPGNP